MVVWTVSNVAAYPGGGPTEEVSQVESLVLTVGEAAKALGISRNVTYALVREGKLPSVRLGAKRLVIPRAALDRFLADASGMVVGHG